MGWSLTYQPTREPELLDRFFLAAGKALHLANLFERKCEYVLETLHLVASLKETDDPMASLALIAAMKTKLLGPTIKELKTFPHFTADDIERLDKARGGRNFIAHRGASIGSVTHAKAQTIIDQARDLRSAVADLAQGDNLVSKWIYEIEEKRGAPAQIQQIYETWIDNWVFEAFDDFIALPTCAEN
jgi:hypothetical protein